MPPLCPTPASLILHLFFPEPEEMRKSYFKVYNYGRSNTKIKPASV